MTEPVLATGRVVAAARVLMTEPVLMAERVIATRPVVPGPAGGRLWCGHIRMILCSEQVLDFESKTSDQERSGR
jgi:hypothetical protein